MLGSDYLKNVIGGALAKIYEDGVLEVFGMSTTRDPSTGSFPVTKLSEHPIKLQFAAVTEEMQRDPDFAATDVRLLILQKGLAVSVTSECFVVARGERFAVKNPIREDAARAYWDARCSRIR